MLLMLRCVLLLCGLVHLLPVTAVLGQAQIAALYGVEVQDANVVLLLQHRAILFALLGLMMIFFAYKQRYLTLICSAAVISMTSFVFLALMHSPVHALIQRVMWIDVVLLGLLSSTWVLWRIYRTEG